MKFLKMFGAGLLAFVVGSFLCFFLWVLILVGVAASSEKPVVVSENTVLKLDLSESIADAPTTDPFAGLNFQTMEITPQLSLLQALRAIETAKEDERIKGIYLRMNGAGTIGGVALMEELREALLDFKQSGKFIVSYNENYSQADYYLASVADKIYLHPEGGMEWIGLASNLTFYKGLFDKLDVKVEIFRPTVCKYKSAVEPFFLKKMSPENREQMQALVNSLWGTLSGAVAEARGIEPATLKKLTDNLSVSLPEEALEHRFVDGLLYEDEMEGVFAELGVEKNKEGEYQFVTLGEYAGQMPLDTANLFGDQVAIVYAEGSITDGEGPSSEGIFGNTLAETLAKVRKDEAVKAVVLRVNSPGGSALASDVIWREMQLLKAQKPVVVSMGDYAASGGYYISCPADVVLSDATTLTGSIGVFGMIPYVNEALQKNLGITFDGVSSNANADMMGTRPLTPAQRAMIMRGVDKVYATFTGNVAEGRNLPLDRVLEIAGGRVWSGVEAKQIGLVDGIGGLKAAIAQAVDKAGLSEDVYVKEVMEEPEGFAAVFSSLGVRIKAAVKSSQVGMLLSEYNSLDEALSHSGIQMYSPYTVEM